MRALRAVTVMLMMVGLAPTAMAQEVSSEVSAIAHNHLDNANRYFGLHRYDEAAREFQEAYDITHLPDLLFNIGRANEEGGHLAEALDGYRRYEGSGAPGVDHAVVTSHIETVRHRIAPQAPPRPHEALRVPVAAPHPVALHADGIHSGLLPIGLIVGGGVALGAGLVLGVGVMIAHSDVVSHCPTDGGCPTTYYNEEQSARVRGYIGDGLGIAGIAAAVTGVILLLTRGSTPAPPRAPQVSAMCTVTGCMGGLRVTF